MSFQIHFKLIFVLMCSVGRGPCSPPVRRLGGLGAVHGEDSPSGQRCVCPGHATRALGSIPLSWPRLPLPPRGSTAAHSPPLRVCGVWKLGREAGVPPQAHLPSPLQPQPHRGPFMSHRGVQSAPERRERNALFSRRAFNEALQPRRHKRNTGAQLNPLFENVRTRLFLQTHSGLSPPFSARFTPLQLSRGAG